MSKLSVKRGASMKYVVGIDGGGTKTLLRLADLEGNLLGCCEGGPVNMISIDSAMVESTLKKLMADALKQTGEDISDCKALCIGVAGAGRSAEKQAIQDILCKIGCGNTAIITDDARIALYGGTGSDEGIVLISGTGSICYGRNSRGVTCRAGGWGYIIGDEGSGYDIGLSALKHTMRVFDGRDVKSLLFTLVLKRLQINNVDEIVSLIYRSGEGKAVIADLASVTDEAFRQGDAIAEKILSYAAAELYISAETVIRELDLNNGCAKLALGGNVLIKSEYMNETLRDMIHRAYPEIEVFGIKKDAAWGAVHMALNYLKGKELFI